MNLSILSVSVNGNMDNVVRQRAQFLMDNSRKRVRVVFVKKDGSERSMVCVPKHQYNDLIGKETTEVGRHIVESKANHGMVVVSELCQPDSEHGEVWMRPRTIPLAKIIQMEVLK